MVTLALTGRALHYFHNGIIDVDSDGNLMVFINKKKNQTNHLKIFNFSRKNHKLVLKIVVQLVFFIGRNMKMIYFGINKKLVQCYVHQKYLYG